MCDLFRALFSDFLFKRKNQRGQQFKNKVMERVVLQFHRQTFHNHAGGWDTVHLISVCSGAAMFHQFSHNAAKTTNLNHQRVIVFSQL